MEIVIENKINIANFVNWGEPQNSKEISKDLFENSTTPSMESKLIMDLQENDSHWEPNYSRDTQTEKPSQENKSELMYREKGNIENPDDILKKMNVNSTDEEKTDFETVDIGILKGSEISEETNYLEGEESKEYDADSPIKESRSRLQPIIDSNSSEDEAEDIGNVCELTENSECVDHTGDKIEDSPDKEKSDYEVMKSRLKALCDSESSEDERDDTIQHAEHLSEREEYLSKPKNKSNRSRKMEKSLVKKMTHKEYENQRLEIRSESQRMQRERNVSLPYHRPKARSLKEFLEKRPRFIAALAERGVKTPPVLAIKLTNQNLAKITKKLEEREKLLENFYKSESESEEENVEAEVKTDNDKPHNVSEIETGVLNKEFITQNIVKNAEDSENNEDIFNKEPDSDKNEKDSNQRIGTKITEEGNSAQDTFKTAKIPPIQIISNIVIPSNSEKIFAITDYSEYDFSLENVELTENITDPINQTEDDKSYADKDNYVFDDSVNFDSCDSLPQQKKMNRLQLLKEALKGNFTPKLSGDPNDMIDLNEEGTNEKATGSSGIDKLIERFIKHTKRTVVPKEDSVQVDILTLSGGELHKEIVTMPLHVDTADEPVAVIETPGAKLKKLRYTLQSQMAQRRSEMWKQKHVLENIPSTDSESRSKEGYEKGCDYDILDDEEEFDIEEEEEEDEELIEDDVDMNERKRRKKSAFIEEEAELSQSDDDKDDKVDEDDEDDEDNGNLGEETEIKEQDSHITQTSGKKKLKRIINMDDSDDDENKSIVSISNITPKDLKAAYKGPLDSTDPWDDEDDDSLLYPNAQRPPSRQRTPQPTRSSNALGFITPVRQLTALQSLQSFETSPIGDEHDQIQQQQEQIRLETLVPLPPNPSPLRGNAWHRHLLFPECDNGEAGSSTVDMEELANEICSGKFPSSLCSEKTSATIDDVDHSNFIKPAFNNVFSLQSSQPSTQDVLDICSGNFTCTTPQNEKTNDVQEIALRDHFEKTSNKPELLNEPLFKEPTVESLDDDDDKIISQLLDEEEMENFKKKFESPINMLEKADISPKSPICGRIMFDTSDEEDEDTVRILKKKRENKCLIEDSDDEEDRKKNEKDEDISEENAAEDYQNVDYDSDENEEMAETPARTASLNVNDFLENEAELSESEWDSADEDERDLDELDIEVGDEEKFDEQKLRSGIGRVQLRQMLDEDNEDLKHLQEMLLEDGELHGTGRERQFKWKNIDNAFDLDRDDKNGENEECLDDAVDSEEIWRKKRHERVLFLESKKASQETENDNILSNNSIIKLGQKAIVCNASSQNFQLIAEESQAGRKQISLTVTQPFTLLNKRGSFLSRGEKVLAKVAEFSKTDNISTKPTKFSRNFLFSTFLNHTQTEETNSKKRKADDGTPTAIKKLRLNNLVSPATSVSGKNNAKKLFGFYHGGRGVKSNVKHNF